MFRIGGFGIGVSVDSILSPDEFKGSWLVWFWLESCFRLNTMLWFNKCFRGELPTNPHEKELQSMSKRWLGEGEEEGRFVVPKNYAVSKQLGRGVSGFVMLARTNRDHKLVAMKFMDSSDDWEVEVEAYEAVAAAKLCGVPNPATVCLLDKGTTRVSNAAPKKQIHYVVLEYLEDCFEGGELFVEEKAANWLISVPYWVLLMSFMSAVQKLRAISRAGLAIRDVKPTNMMFSRKSGHATFIDLGMMCKAADVEIEFSGCSYYAAPEMLSLESKLANVESARHRSSFWRAADVWALALTFCDILTAKYFLSRNQPLPYDLFPNSFQEATGRWSDRADLPVEKALKVYGKCNPQTEAYTRFALPCLDAVFDLMARRTGCPEGARLVEALRFLMLVEGDDELSGVKQALVRARMRNQRLQHMAQNPKKYLSPKAVAK
jgi:serine/threonine protein kinase